MPKKKNLWIRILRTNKYKQTWRILVLRDCCFNSVLIAFLPLIPYWIYSFSNILILLFFFFSVSIVTLLIDFLFCFFFEFHFFFLKKNWVGTWFLQICIMNFKDCNCDYWLFVFCLDWESLFYDSFLLCCFLFQSFVRDDCVNDFYFFTQHIKNDWNVQSFFKKLKIIFTDQIHNCR